MGEPKICITTFYDKKFEKIGDICLKSLEKYCDIFGIDLVRYDKNLSDRPPAWNKIQIVRELIKKYDYVVWIDADALFVRFDEDIRKEIVDGKDFYISLVDFKGRKVPNSGFFVVRRSEWSEDFLRKVWEMEEYIYHNYWENAAIIDLMGYNDTMFSNRYKLFVNKMLYKMGIKSFMTVLSNKLGMGMAISKIFPDSVSEGKNSAGIDLSKVKYIDNKWNSLPGRAESDGAVVHHYPAKPFAERLEMMTKDLEGAGI